MNFGALSPEHIYPTLGVVCRPGCHYCRWSNHSLLSWGTLWYRFYYILILTYLIVFITYCFIRKWHATWILIPSAFVVWAIGFYFSFLDCWSVVWLLLLLLFFFFFFFFFVWLFGRFWLVGLWVWVHSGAGWLLAWPPDRTTITSLLVFTELKSSADHNGWQPGCKWTSQFWNVSLFRGTGPWPMNLHVRYFTTS